MKKIFITLVSIISLNATAQDNSGVFFDFGVGTRLGGEVSDKATLGAGFHMNGGVGYMFTSYLGIKGDLGYNAFSAESVTDASDIDRSYMVRASIQGVLSISDLAFNAEKFGLRFHTGFGLNTFSNPHYKEVYTETNEFKDPYFKGNDDALSVIVGLTPEYIISEKLSITADVSYVTLFKQSHNIDREFGTTNIDKNTGISTISVGVSYKL